MNLQNIRYKIIFLTLLFSYLFFVINIFILNIRYEYFKYEYSYKKDIKNGFLTDCFNLNDCIEKGDKNYHSEENRDSYKSFYYYYNSYKKYTNQENFKEIADSRNDIFDTDTALNYFKKNIEFKCENYKTLFYLYFQKSDYISAINSLLNSEIYNKCSLEYLVGLGYLKSQKYTDSKKFFDLSLNKIDNFKNKECTKRIINIFLNKIANKSSLKINKKISLDGCSGNYFIDDRVIYDIVNDLN